MAQGVAFPREYEYYESPTTYESVGKNSNFRIPTNIVIFPTKADPFC